jgi:hypothetical protein
MDPQADKVPVGREPLLRGGSPCRDIKLEHIAVAALPDLCRLLCYGRGERDRGTLEIADREIRLPRHQLHDEDLVVRPSPVQVQERARFIARCLKMWQEVRFRLLCEPTRIRHQVGELGEVSGECLPRSDATTTFVDIPTLPDHAPIVA